MANIGAEVGQKMRSAIKAKLLELNCYVDDELPDYIMVMVANKRTKSQMKDDLQLFLTSKTETFVDWLHIVLKKLKEVTITNPEVYKKTAKRKSDELSNVNVKKEKKEKKTEKKVKKTETLEERSSLMEFKSLTDDLPISANRLSEQRKIIVMKENKSNNAERVIEDSFDIPLLSEVNMSSEQELEDIEKKIKNVKSRLGLLVESEDDDEDIINLKAEPGELFTNNDDIKTKNRKIRLIESTPEAVNSSSSEPKKSERTRITFSSDEMESPNKRKSVLERLGKRRLSDNSEETPKRTRIDLSEFRNGGNKKEKDKRNVRMKESILNRLGVMSKVSVPSKTAEEPEEPLKNREVPSVVKIKPRVIPPDTPQANKNLLLKAVAEAQRSVAQAPKVGSTLKPDALYTKKYKEKMREEHLPGKKLPENEKNKIKKLLTPTEPDNESLKYVPTPIAKNQEAPRYIPSTKLNGPNNNTTKNDKVKQQFIVTLDGIEKTKFKDLLTEETSKPSIKSRLDKKKSPSPIIFDKVTSTSKPKSNIPDKLPLVHAPPSIKNKERCKYWPNCRQNEKCEFLHPTAVCEKFPHCKFGDKCLYLHPMCKFGSSCTRKDCSYSHNSTTFRTAMKITPPSTQVCKFYPNCSNVACVFYHPKPCKFGSYCKNMSDCLFSHPFVPNKSLTWRPK